LLFSYSNPSSSNFKGRKTTNFTSANQLFLSNPDKTLWRFEVVYTFSSETSASSLNFVINQPPSNGSCSIDPLNGTTLTQFNISCPNWFDQDEIKDYSLLVWSDKPSDRQLIGFSMVSTFQVRLPSGNDSTNSLQLMVSIRDRRECVTEWNLTLIYVRPDLNSITNLMNDFQSLSNTALINNPVHQLLSTGNPNTVGQIVSSLSKEFNRMNTDNLNNAVSSNLIVIIFKTFSYFELF
jgi:REJ domain